MQAAVLAKDAGRSTDDKEAEALALSLGRGALKAAAAAHVPQRAAQAHFPIHSHATIISPDSAPYGDPHCTFCPRLWEVVQLHAQMEM